MKILILPLLLMTGACATILPAEIAAANGPATGDVQRIDEIDGHGPDPGSAEDRSATAFRQLRRIAELDDTAGGPQLNAVIASNPDAPAQAA